MNYMLDYMEEAMEGRRPEEDCTRTEKLFQVTDERSGRRCIIKFEQYSDFEKRCKDKFGYRQEMDVVFELEEEQVELDESAFEALENKTKLKIREIDGRRHDEDVTRTDKLFQVIDEVSGRRFVVKFEQYSNFEQRCKDKFGYLQEMDVVFEMEDEQVELDESAFEALENKTKLKIRTINGRNPPPHQPGYSNPYHNGYDQDNSTGMSTLPVPQQVIQMQPPCAGINNQPQTIIINNRRGSDLTLPSIIVCFFCCCLTGIPAIIYAMKAQRRYAEEQWVEAEVYQKRSHDFMHVSIVIHVFIWIIVISLYLW